MNIMEQLTGLGKPKVYPVKFELPRYNHLNGDVSTEQGVFVRLCTIRINALLRASMGCDPDSILNMINSVCGSAVNYQGIPLFNENDPSHVSMLTLESPFTYDIWQEAMIVNGIFKRRVLNEEEEEASIEKK